MRYLEHSLLLQRPVQYSRALYERDHVEEDNQRSKRKRNRDRPRTSAALLFFAEDDSARLFVHVFTTTLALLASNPRVDQQHREQDE